MPGCQAKWGRRFRLPTSFRIVWWAAPPVLFVLLWWRGLQCWFQEDDFVWLGLRRRVYNLDSLLREMFLPTTAQGSFRPFSERGFFLSFRSWFDMDALPFHLMVYLTVCADLLLLSWIVGRLTGSRLAGFAAPVIWMANANLLKSISWNSAYNQSLCGFCLLFAFTLLLRSIETGDRRYFILQWCVFLFGFGVIETNVVYPALAGLYTWLFARKYFARIAPMFGVSALFAILHMVFAKKQATGLYALHLDGSMLKTLAAYWRLLWDPVHLHQLTGLPDALGDAALVVFSLALAAFVVACLRRRQWLPVFFLGWFVFPLLPVLPLRDHVTGYYLTLPLLGIAMTGAYALAMAWDAKGWLRAMATGLAVWYLLLWTPAVRAGLEWQYERGRDAERLVHGVEEARRLHPGKTILLTGITDNLFAEAVRDGAFEAVGVDNVYLAPEGADRLVSAPGAPQPVSFVMPPEFIPHALGQGRLAVYQASGPRLRNITTIYAAGYPPQMAARWPRRVDVANPFSASVLGPTWYRIEHTFRWMPQTATLTMAGPRSAEEKLHVSGYCPPLALQPGPRRLTLTVGGSPLGTVTLDKPGMFTFDFALPADTVGRPNMEVELSVNRASARPEDGHPLGLVFGVFEIR